MSSVDGFDAEMITLLNTSGGLRNDDSARKLVAMLDNAHHLGTSRDLVLVVLRKTVPTPSVLAEFVRSGGVKHIKTWLRSASKDTAAPEKQELFIKECLRGLEVLPIDLATLQSSEVGKSVARMSTARGGAAKFSKGTCHGPVLALFSRHSCDACVCFLAISQM